MTTGTPAVCVDNVVFRYDNQPIIDIPKLEVTRGEKLFLRGPSGSGKSTLLGLIGGILVPQAGRINVLDQPLSALSATQRDRFRADHVGFVFQMFNLLPYLSLTDNVVLPCHFSQIRTKTALARSNTLTGEAARLLARLGLTDPRLLSRPVTELSMGQQQRVAVARALIGKPDLVIADEPTSALDTDARMHFIKLLIDECTAADTTVIFVSHDPSLSVAFDRSLSLNDINQAPVPEYNHVA